MLSSKASRHFLEFMLIMNTLEDFVSYTIATPKADNVYRKDGIYLLPPDTRNKAKLKARTRYNNMSSAEKEAQKKRNTTNRFNSELKKRGSLFALANERFRTSKNRKRGKNSTAVPITYNLNEQKELEAIGEGKCFYTGRLMVTTKDSPDVISLDRTDSSLGYIDGNVRWVCKIFNLAKSNYSVEYFIQFCLDVVNTCRKRNGLAPIQLDK